LFARMRSFDWVQEYKRMLRHTPGWSLPWDDAHHMIFYTLIQERATQITYLNTATIAAGKSGRAEFANDADPVLEQVCLTIAMDEAAHYNFFLEVARLMIYYYPAQSLEALLDVIKHFAMPAGDIIPDFEHFEAVVARANIFHPQIYVRDVLRPVLRNLSVSPAMAFAHGGRRPRMEPDPDGNAREDRLFDLIAYDELEKALKRLYGKIEKYEQEVGFADLDATAFVPSGLADGFAAN
ncbi:MAG TPA: acyl-ACP desaturase, partial [Pyrinomonadaceae bacterium]|nr:acyl-ACP desaturase [Pyrinomonadaceae bacterium]